MKGAGSSIPTWRVDPDRPNRYLARVRYEGDLLGRSRSRFLRLPSSRANRRVRWLTSRLTPLCIAFTATARSRHVRVYHTLLHTRLQEALSSSAAARSAVDAHRPQTGGICALCRPRREHAEACRSAPTKWSPRSGLAAGALPRHRPLHVTAGAVAVLRRSVRHHVPTQAAPVSGSNDASNRDYAEQMARVLDPPPQNLTDELESYREPELQVRVSMNCRQGVEVRRRIVGSRLNLDSRL
jgi:hypothetical protein